MEKKIIFFVFLFSFITYYAFATRFTFRPIWELDYFNPLASSLLHGRLDIQNPGTTYDLLSFEGKWYTRFGPLSAFFLIPFHIIKGRYIPIVYISVLFATFTVCLFYLLLARVKKDFFPSMSVLDMWWFVILFAFGTTQFYVSTLSSVWHVDQIISSFFGALGFYLILKQKRTNRDYFLSCLFTSFAFLGRITVAFLLILPVFLYVYDIFWKKRKISLLSLIVPIGIFLSLLFIFNYARFHNIFEYGYPYIHEAPYLEQIRLQNGVMSIKNISQNFWYMFLELPKFTFLPKFHFDINLKGNSIFFLTPAFFAAFFANPFLKKGRKYFINPYITGSIIATVTPLFFVLLYYSTGWIQFGYRYSLDFLVPLLILCIFGMKGKVNKLFVGSIIFSVILNVLGITALW